MHLAASSLKMKECTQHTLHIALQTNFDIIYTSKYGTSLSYYKVNMLATTTEIQKVKKTPTPQAPFENH